MSGFWFPHVFQDWLQNEAAITRKMQSQEQIVKPYLTKRNFQLLCCARQRYLLVLPTHCRQKNVEIFWNQAKMNINLVKQETLQRNWPSSYHKWDSFSLACYTKSLPFHHQFLGTSSQISRFSPSNRELRYTRRVSSHS